MGEKDEKPIRVVDRRMFTPDGELRPDFEPEEPAEPPPRPPAPAASNPSPPPPAPASRPPSPSPSSTAPPAPPAPHEIHGHRGESELPGAAEETGEAEAEAGGPPPSSEPRSEFTAIVRSLATTAYSALGLLPDPSGARHREPAVARQMIDWLSVLESKTRNNLSFEESDFLSRVLYELRMAFVEVMGPGGGGSGRPRPAGR
jgi:hypothetical protein